VRPDTPPLAQYTPAGSGGTQLHIPTFFHREFTGCLQPQRRPSFSAGEIVIGVGSCRYQSAFDRTGGRVTSWQTASCSSRPPQVGPCAKVRRRNRPTRPSCTRLPMPTSMNPADTHWGKEVNRTGYRLSRPAMFSIVATLKQWNVNPRRWLSWYLESCAAAGGRVPEDVKRFLPWNLTADCRAELTSPEASVPINDSSSRQLLPTPHRRPSPTSAHAFPVHPRDGVGECLPAEHLTAGLYEVLRCMERNFSYAMSVSWVAESPQETRDGPAVADQGARNRYDTARWRVGESW